MNASLAARSGPLSLLAVALVPFVGAVGIHDTRVGLWGMAAIGVLAILVLRELRGTWWRLGLAAIAGGSIAVSTWIYGGQDADNTAAAALRVLYIVLPGALVTAYLEPSALGDHLAQRLRMPPRVVVASVAALQRVDQMHETWQQIARARRARGIGLEGGPIRRVRAGGSILFALLVSTLRTSGRMAVAMDARGFAGAHRRTWAEPAPWRLADSVLLLCALVLAAWPWCVRWWL